MITTITLNYSDRGKLGTHELRHEVRHHGINAYWVDKAIEYVVSEAGRRGSACAIFTYEDGSGDAIWQDYHDAGTRNVTVRHDYDAATRSNSGPKPSTTAKVKRLVKAHLGEDQG